ncbi:MAG TPA: hypothetical protein VHO28_14175, partial [Ignavibacteriales bacterium]|nr:hypothetical protein [Ignavibacteriales bacterium]
MKKVIFILACLLLFFVVYESFKEQPELSVEQPPMVPAAAAEEPEPERKLYDLVSIETSFNKNFNNIDSIAAHDNKVYYYSKAGMISYGKRSDSWKVDTIPYKRLQVNSEKNVDQKIPPMFHRYAYAAVGDRCSIDNYEIVLMKFGTEGCYGVSGIFDTVRNIIFYPKEELYKCVAFDNENIYLGQPYGLSVISRDEEIINDYAVLPYLSGESNLHLSGSNVWIASDRIGIQKIDKSSGNELTFWSYYELAGLIDSAEIRKSILEYSQIKFTNFCENDSLLFIGYKVIGDPYF